VDRQRWSQTDNEENGLTVRNDINCTSAEETVDESGVTNANCGYKNTPRRYHTAGLETRFYKDINWFGKPNNLKYGIKFEFEKIERKARQTGSDKKQTGNQMAEDGTEFAKMSEDAEVYALALYLEDDIQTTDKLTLTPGVRYESYYLIHNDRERKDGCGTTSVTDCNNYTSYEKDEYILLPGLGFTYEANNENQVYGGIHMGMAPPAVGDAGYRQISNLKSQKSFNFELGLINNSFEDKLGLTFETAAFRTVERDRPVKSSLRTAGTGSTLKNIGTTFSDGVEFSANWDQSRYSKKLRNWFATLSYSFMYPKLKTHQKGERSSSDAGSPIVVDDIFENDIPFVPRHKGLVTIGYGASNKWDISTTARYRGEYFTDIDNTKGIGQSGRWGQVDDHWIINARGNYTLSKFNNSTLYLSLTNIFDTVYIASISAEGLKVGNGRSIMTGIEYNF
jgi:Fe(3+) dicitrate transport protein